MTQLALDESNKTHVALETPHPTIPHVTDHMGQAMTSHNHPEWCAPDQAISKGG